MTLVHVLSAAPEHTGGTKAFSELNDLIALAKRDRFGIHALVASPRDADFILFVEHSTDAGAYFQRVRRHELHRRRPHDCFLFSSTDRLIPFLPGIYAGIERSWYRSCWTRPGPYLGIGQSLDVVPGAARRDPQWLFSFVGTPHSAPVRARVLALKHPRALIRNTADANRNALTPAEYADTIRDSAFVLCPRGGGTASFRLFETLLHGRVPVIISDEWMAPEGPDWTGFSLRVAEADVPHIPSLLEAREPAAAEMGRAAREAWEEWFAPDVLFHRIVEWCLDIEATAPSRGRLMRLFPYVQLLRPYHTLRWAARSFGHGSWRLPRWLYTLLGVPTR